MSYRLSVANWPFAVKFAVPSALALLMFAFLAVMASSMVSGLEDDLEDVVNRKFNAAMMLASDVDKLRAANGGLYEMHTLTAAELPVDIKSQSNKIITSLDSVLADLQSYKDNYASEEDMTKIDEAFTNLKKYKGAVDFVSSMLAVNFKATVKLITPLAASYEKTIGELMSITENALTSSKAQSQKTIAKAAFNRRVLYAICIPMLLATAFVMVMIVSATVRSVRRVAEATRTLAGGNTNLAIEELDRGDELGDVVQALEVFRNNIIAKDRMDASLREEARRKELRTERLENEIKAFEKNVAQVATQVVEAATLMTVNSESMAKVAKDTSEKITQIASASQQAGGNVERMVGATERLNTSIGGVGTTVQSVLKHVAGTIEKANDTGKTVNSLNTLTEKIGSIVALVQEIANQTNMLALNATIEAARAGEAGKGFAVVAGEVKNLANQTSTASDEITKQIANMQAATKEANQSVAAIASNIVEVNKFLMEIEASSRQEGEVTKEISANVSETTEAARGINKDIDVLIHASSRIGMMATDAFDGATDLARQSGVLKEFVQNFINSVRTA